MPACTVYFDGACPVCRTEIAHYQRQRGAKAIAWVDASNCEEEALGPGVDRASALSRFHVRKEDGTLVSGAPAFVAIWRHLPAFAGLAKLASFRPVLAALDAGYGLFLRVRPWWRPAHTTASLYWTIVFTVVLGCVIVVIAKGPAYVADAHPLPDADAPLP